MTHRALRLRASATALAVSCLSSGAVLAADNFVITTTVGTNTATYGFKSAEEAVNAIEVSNLRTRLAYTGVEPVNMLINYRGLPVTLVFPTTNSTSLQFSVPALNINRTFNGVGATVSSARDNAQDQLSDFLKSGDVLGQIMKKLAEVSPVDPIAGNPNSLQSMLVASDFNNAFTSHASNIVAGGQAGTPNLVGLGLRFGSYSQGGLKSQAYTLPLSYTIRPDIDPRRQLSFTLPITVGNVEGAQTYHAAAGVNYRIPMNDRWALTPGGNWAITGSKDLGSVAQIASASLTSSYVIEMGADSLAIGNMVGYYQTMKFSAGGYSFDPDIKNTVFRNGVMYSMPTSLWGGGKSMEYSFINTTFTGTDLYNKSTNEIGATIGTNKGASARSYLRAGGTYLFSSKTHGVSFNVGYWF